MENNKQANKSLLVLGVSFIVVFAFVLIMVNSWLKNTLKEETVAEKPAAPIAAAAKPKYIQPPIELPDAPEKQKSAVTEETATAEAKPAEKAPGANEKFLEN